MEKNISVSLSTINRAIDSFHYTLKRISLVPIRRNTEKNINTRQNYARLYMQLITNLSEEKIFFFDEAGFSISMKPTRGRSAANTRAIHTVRYIRSINISLICIMNKNAIQYYATNENAFNSSSLEICFRKFFTLLQTQQISNITLIGDNVSFHKSQNIQNLINEFGHNLMYLPPYSPYLNPVENVFSKWN